MRTRFLVLALVAGLMSWLLLGCGDCKKFDTKTMTCKKEDEDENNQASQCPDPSDTSIKGAENRKSTTLDRPGRWHSQIHLEMVNPVKGYHHFKWVVGLNRQTCSSGYISESSGYQQYLQISASPGSQDMRMVGGMNYAEYAVYGCVSEKDTVCQGLVETGTLVINVNYIP